MPPPGATKEDVLAWAASRGLDTTTDPPNENVVIVFNQANAKKYTGPKTVFGRANRP